MNVISRYEPDPPIQDLVPEVDRNESELAAIVGIVRRQLPVIVIMAILGVAGAAFYLFTATPWYSASADVIMEMRRPIAHVAGNLRTPPSRRHARITVAPAPANRACPSPRRRLRLRA